MEPEVSIGKSSLGESSIGEKEINKEKTQRHLYGTYYNVLLSDEQLEKLKTEFPTDWEERIERVSEYCASTGKSYKDYLATIRNWARNDKKKEPKKEANPFAQMLKEEVIDVEVV